MLNEDASKYGMDETVQKLAQDIAAHNWKVTQQYSLDKGAAKLGMQIRPVVVIELGSPAHSAKILENGEYGPTKVMMPARIAVYEKENGEVYISQLNLSLLGAMFVGVVKEVMAGAQDEHDAMVKDLVQTRS